ncbi:MAG: hypothetical protein ACXIVQ_11005 [Acidimicrobiales bacterium]
MRVSIETVIDAATTERFLALYRAAFAPLSPVAAGRQSLTDDEFRAEMAEESALKFVGWNRDDEPVAMAVMNTDLDTLPWISGEFWRLRYPDHAARGAIYYYGAILVSPDVKGGPWMYRILVEGTRYTAQNRAIAAFDCCRYNVEEVKLPQMIADVGHKIANLEIEEVDTQHYYAYIFDGLRDGQAGTTR